MFHVELETPQGWAKLAPRGLERGVARSRRVSPRLHTREASRVRHTGAKKRSAAPDPQGTVHRHTASTVHAPAAGSLPSLLRVLAQKAPVSHYPQTYAPDQRTGQNYRRFRGNVRPANKRGPRPRRSLNQGRSAKFASRLSQRAAATWLRAETGWTTNGREPIVMRRIEPNPIKSSCSSGSAGIRPGR